MKNFNRPPARKSAYAKASADKGGSKMKNLIRLVVAMVLIFCSTIVFAGTAKIEVKGGANTLLGVGYEEDGKYQRIVDFRPGSELHGQEAIAFRDAFLEIKERLPEKSFFEIARFPEVPRYHVRLSDGHVYVAVGSGPTVEAAFDNLVANFK